jgi:hypothetical protein
MSCKIQRNGASSPACPSKPKNKIMRTKKNNYYLVIQQNYGYGWEDNSQYICKSDGTPTELSGKFRETKSGLKIPISLYKHDLMEYIKTGYNTRTICRKEPIN